MLFHMGLVALPLELHRGIPYPNSPRVSPTLSHPRATTRIRMTLFWSARAFSWQIVTQLLSVWLSLLEITNPPGANTAELRCRTCLIWIIATIIEPAVRFRGSNKLHSNVRPRARMASASQFIFALSALSKFYFETRLHAERGPRD